MDRTPEQRDLMLTVLDLLGSALDEIEVTEDLLLTEALGFECGNTETEEAVSRVFHLMLAVAEAEAVELRDDRDFVRRMIRMTRQGIIGEDLKHRIEGDEEE